MADTRILFPSQPLLPIENHAKIGTSVQPLGKASFANALQKAQAKERVSFSGHALQRLQERNLSFSEKDLDKLDTTVTKLQEKGAREALVYLNDVALVVSIANRTVITAMDGNSAKDNIITNIDSAAIL